MKKPLILLVDDERSVLDALEAELRPAFESISRIESYDDPRDALAAVPRWAEERRPVAVAIVDQRMPGMSGVELLRRLSAAVALTTAGGCSPSERDSAPTTYSPCAHLRAALLTGYGGLNSALAGKNEADVVRYLEKPWRIEVLKDAVGSLFAAWMRESENGKYFQFREVTTRAELGALLRLRYDVYSLDPQVAGVLTPSESGIDLDPYDMVARFFGLFALADEGEQMIGTLRVCDQMEGPAATVLRQLAEGHADLEGRINAPRTEPLPSMVWFIDRDAVAALYELLMASGERVVEPGRLTLRPAHRAGGGAAGSPRLLARHILDAATAFFFCLRIENAIVTCVPLHVRLYTPLGFKQVAGTRIQWQPRVKAEKACLHGTCSGVPSPARERVLALAERVRKAGGACQCPTFPDCLPGPCATGDFRSVDLFCPIAASDVLVTAPD